MIRRLSAAAFIALMIASVLVVGGCAKRSAQRPKPQTESTATTDATSSARGSSETTAGERGTLPANEAASFEKELSDIERELKDLSLPDDREFDQAAGALY